ncbi:MAG: NAD(+)/NADH kinase [Haloarculaceae archaeon]
MKVGIVARRENPRAASLADELRCALDERGVEVWVDETTAASLTTGDSVATDVVARPVEAMADCDLVVSVGGDGTLLFAARSAGTVPVMGVNLGEVGFLNAVAPEDAVDAVTDAVEQFRETGAVGVRELPRVCASGADWSLDPALNEVAVLGSQRGHGYGIEVEVRIDGDLYTGGHADGVLVATPTGSTAYNLSEGGPLVHPTVDALVVTEMCADDAMPPLVVGTDSEVTVRVDGADGAVAVADGRVTRDLSPPTRVRFSTSDAPARIAGPPLDFFGALGKLD